MSQTSSPIATDTLPWMPLEEGVWARCLRFAGEQRSLQLKVDPGVTIPPHRHDGEVHAYTVSGRRRLDTGEIAGPGDYVYEPGGNVDSWSCKGDEPCVIQISMTGRLAYVDADGREVSATDTESLRQKYLAWCRDNGLGPQAIGAV
jgi:quercetin dioxygenase-like cupin family protein